MTAIRITRNVRSIVSALRGALIRLSPDGATATVLDRDSGKLARVSADTLVATKGRPVNLVRGLCRADVDELIEGDAGFAAECMTELFVRQTADEREVRQTRHLNRVGFRADDALVGSTLAGKSLCAWTETDHAMARDVAKVYSGTQLWDLASLWLQAGDASEASVLLSDVLSDLAAMAARDAGR